MAPRILKVSSAAYNELVEALKAIGIDHPANAGEFVVQKDDMIKQPHDFRMVQVRRDSMTIAAQAYAATPEPRLPFLEFNKTVFEWIMNGEKENGKESKA